MGHLSHPADQLKKEAIMNFKQDIVDYISAEFRYFKIPYSPSADMATDLLRLFTIQKKYIFQVPRSVEMSKELRTRLDGGHAYQKGIEKLIGKLEKGQDVNSHQSKNLFNFHVHDSLVYDWKIYHLHLSSHIKSGDYFTERTKEVLFVYINPQQALLLDILPHPPHDNFANKLLLEIIDNNWKNILTQVNGITGLSHDLNQQERFKLRKHNVNEGVVEVNGRFIFAPGSGKTTSGHSVEDILKLNELQRWLEQNETAILRNKTTVDKMFMERHRLRLKPEYKIVFTEQGPQIWESRSKKCLIRYNEVLKLT